MTHAHEAVKTRHKESSLVFPVLALAVEPSALGKEYQVLLNSRILH